MINGMSFLVAIALFWGGVVVGFILNPKFHSQQLEEHFSPRAKTNFKSPLKTYDVYYSEYKNKFGRYEPVRMLAEK